MVKFALSGIGLHSLLQYEQSRTPERSLPLTLSLFPVKFHLGDSLDREQPPFVTGIFSFFSLLFLLLPSSISQRPCVVFIFPCSSFFVFFSFFFFHLPQSSFFTFAGVLNTKGSDISFSCPSTRSGQNPFYPVYVVKIGISRERWDTIKR